MPLLHYCVGQHKEELKINVQPWWEALTRCPYVQANCLSSLLRAACSTFCSVLSWIIKSTETVHAPLVLLEPQVLCKFAAVKKRKSNIDISPPPRYSPVLCVNDLYILDSFTTFLSLSSQSACTWDYCCSAHGWNVWNLCFRCRTRSSAGRLWWCLCTTTTDSPNTMSLAKWRFPWTPSILGGRSRSGGIWRVQIKRRCRFIIDFYFVHVRQVSPF